ncbi:uncharacterized protein DS421_19g660990 [Arachis hypogaea]|uniref:Uncharacterized protein n=1 Tax=Arachis hypogaea TaxID=3818 RepID=A0A6B9VAG7_ARAHY|nr:uncharacterized protein DS421_19g660990 [Arachis hypogaea]
MRNKNSYVFLHAFPPKQLFQILIHLIGAWMNCVLRIVSLLKNSFLQVVVI